MINHERLRHLGLITLDKPKALNALNHEMIADIHAALDEFETDNAIKMILIRSSHDDIFCAGGDVKALYEVKNTRLESLVGFFKSEFRMNYRLKTFSKPIVSLINGICMGGGVGLGMHVAYPIAGQDLVFAMPETLIGLFPDVGSSFILNQLPPTWKNYVGIFGGRLNANQLAAFHLVEGVIAKEKWPQLIEELSAAKDLKHCLEKHLSRCETEFIQLPHPEFWRFEADDFRNLMENLASAQGEFFVDIHERQTHYSPLSMYVTFEQLHLTHGLSFKQCLELDYRLIQHFLHESDFFEGVRAQLIDKDKKPKWLYQDWQSVPTELVKRFFYEDLIADKHLF
jgi:enoyl-CoA hydratase